MGNQTQKQESQKSGSQKPTQSNYILASKTQIEQISQDSKEQNYWVPMQENKFNSWADKYMLVVMYMKLYLHPYMGSLVNRGKSSKLGLKLTQDPLKYTMCLEAELRPGKTQQSGRDSRTRSKDRSRKDQTFLPQRLGSSMGFKGTLNFTDLFYDSTIYKYQ